MRSELGGCRPDHLRAPVQWVEVTRKKFASRARKRAAADARRVVERKGGKFCSAPFATEVARPKRFELLTPRFVVTCQLANRG